MKLVKQWGVMDMQTPVVELFHLRQMNWQVRSEYAPLEPVKSEVGILSGDNYFPQMSCLSFEFYDRKT